MTSLAHRTIDALSDEHDTLAAAVGYLTEDQLTLSQNLGQLHPVILAEEHGKLHGHSHCSPNSPGAHVGYTDPTASTAGCPSGKGLRGGEVEVRSLRS